MVEMTVERQREIVASFMCPNERERRHSDWWKERPAGGKRRMSDPAWECVPDAATCGDLNALRLVETLLTEDQICKYDRLLDDLKRKNHNAPSSIVRVFAWHASPAEKLSALAQVLTIPVTALGREKRNNEK